LVPFDSSVAAIVSIEIANWTGVGSVVKLKVQSREITCDGAALDSGSIQSSASRRITRLAGERVGAFMNHRSYDLHEFESYQCVLQLQPPAMAATQFAQW
jgi:hypothetical protein